VVVLIVVPAEEIAAEATSLQEAAGALGEVGPVLQRLEVRLAEGGVVGDVRLGVRLRHARSAISRATGLDVMEEPLSA